MVDLSKYNNSWYRPGNSAFVRILWYFTNLAVIRNRWNPFSELKVRVLRLFGAKVGRGVVIKPGVNVKYPWRLKIGDYSWIGEGVWIDNLGDVTIGSNCCVSQESLLLCGNHNYRSETFDLIVKSIVIEDGGWVGAKAIICPGITIYSHGIASVGTIVTRDIPAFKVLKPDGSLIDRQ